MLSKFLRLLFLEEKFRIRLIVICCFVFLFALLYRFLKYEKQLIPRLKEESHLASLIPMMQRELKDLEIKKELGVLQHQSDKPMPVISGIFIKDQSPVVLVEDNFLYEGDSLGAYVISKITSRSVILKDKETGRKREVFLSN